MHNVTQPAADSFLRAGGSSSTAAGRRAPEATGAPMRRHLCTLGYDARPWGLGVNGGDPERDAGILGDTVVRLAAQHGPVSLVGWSLGGVVAREVAREHPDVWAVVAARLARAVRTPAGMS